MICDTIRMKNTPDLQPVLGLLRTLKTHNERAWFQAHKAEYVVAQKRFETYVAILIGELSRTEPLLGVSPKDCVFRIYRDVRFSKDKSPYKTYMGAYIAPGGRKSRRLGLYVHLEPGNRSLFGGGLHEADPKQIAAWRAAIDKNPAPFLKIAGAKDFKKMFGTVDGERLKTAPRGYGKDHPRLDLIQLKSVVVTRTLTDAEVLSPRFVAESLRTFQVMRPFLRYLEGITK